MISKEQKESIKSLVNKIVNFEEKIHFKTNSINNISKLIDIIRYDYIVTFHIKDIDYEYDYNSKVVTLVPQYLFKKEEYDLLMEEILSKLTEIKKDIQSLSSNIEKEIFIHDYLCNNVKYFDSGDSSYSIVGPLLYGQGVCEGISKTFHALCKIAKLNSYVLCGDAIDHNVKTPHSWNAIEINSKFSIVDVTFDITLSTNSFVRHDFFNISTNDVKGLYKPIEFHKEIFDMCNSNNYNYFSLNNLVLSDIDAFRYIEKRINKEKSFCFKVLNLNSVQFLDDIKQRLLKKIGINRFEYSINEKLNIIYLKF